MALLREPELGDELADDDYSDEEAKGGGGPSSSATSRRAEKRGRVSFQPGTRPGAELSLYVKEEAPGVWKLAEPSYGARRVSKLVFFCFMRKQISRPSEAQITEGHNDTAGRAACEEDDIEMLQRVLNGRVHPQAQMDWLAIENFAQKYHRGSSFAKCVSMCEKLACDMARASGEPLKKLQAEALKVDLVPLPLTIATSLRQSLVRPAGEDKVYGEGSTKVTIPGQGIAYPSVYGYVNASSFFHRMFGFPAQDPTRDANFMKKIKELRDDHKTVHVACLDVLEDLPFLRQAVFNDETKSAGEKLHLWALILVALEHGCRVSEVSVYSPTLSQVKTPSPSRTHAWDSNGWPKWLEVTRDQWKRKLKKTPAVTQQLHANMVDGGADYCSVTAVLFLLRYYELEGVTDGPLFRHFAKKKKRGKASPVKANFEQKDQKLRSSSGKRSRWWEEYDPGTKKYSKEASLSEDQVYNLLKKVFDDASILAADAGADHSRLAAATPHSFRASMVGWAARSRSSNAYNEARVTGRWVFLSTVFNDYWRFGMQISNDLVGARRGEDKIFSFKPWPAGGTTTALSAEASSSSHGGGMEGDVSLRKRRRGTLDEDGEKRKKEKNKLFKKLVKKTREISAQRMRQ